MAGPGHYYIRVRGWVSKRLVNQFDGISMSHGYDRDNLPVTTILIAVPDQSALRGVLCTIWDLNLLLLSVARFKMKGVDGNE
jgi:hypothetical protein